MSELVILIVDDDATARRTYARMIANGPEPARVVQSCTMTEGLATVFIEAADAILLDYYLPDGDGLAFMNELADHRGVLPVPVVMLTGGGDEMLATEVLKAGASDYVAKGWLDPESLWRALRYAIGRHRLRQQVEQQQIELAASNAQLRVRQENLERVTTLLKGELEAGLSGLAGRLRVLAQALPEAAAASAAEVDQLADLAGVVHANVLGSLAALAGEPDAELSQRVELQGFVQSVAEGLSERLEGVAIHVAPMEAIRTRGGPLRTAVEQLLIDAAERGARKILVSRAEPVGVCLDDDGRAIPKATIEHVIESAQPPPRGDRCATRLSMVRTALDSLDGVLLVERTRSWNRLSVVLVDLSV